MNLAYVTLDEVHQDLAQRLAMRSRVKLRAFWPTESVSARFEAVLYDLDYLPAEQREQVLSRLMAGPVQGIRAVHGYNLRGRQTKALRRNGVVVRRRLDLRLFRALLQRTAESVLATS